LTKKKEVTHVSWWFNVCHTGLETFEDKLILDNVMAEDEAMQVDARAESRRAIDEPRLPVDDVDVDRLVMFINFRILITSMLYYLSVLTYFACIYIL
jgi:hypothetical protein